MRRRTIPLVIVFALAMFSHGIHASEDPQAPPPFAIASMSVSGTNLVLYAGVPSGVTVILETRPTLTATWTFAASVLVATNTHEAIFTIPKPTGATAFFRLRVENPPQVGVQISPDNARAVTATEQAIKALISRESQYVAMPSLAESMNDAGEAIFHFTGEVDGSDKIVITHEGALWTHVNWGWPKDAAIVNGTRWNASEKNYLTTTGGTKFLPETFSLDSVRLEVLRGRDVVALERGTNSLIVYLDDTPSDSAMYEFKIYLRTNIVMPPPAASTAATLKIAGEIDGSERIKITALEAKWNHKTRSYPSLVTINGQPWDPILNNVLTNAGDTEFLPKGVDFTSAKIVHREGRDLATMWAEKDALWVTFADNPNASDHYELEISFGQ